MITETTFALPDPISYSKDGKPGLKTAELILKAPSHNERRFARRLKQKLTGAMMALRGRAGDQEAPDPEGDESRNPTGQELAMLLMSVDESVLDWGEFADWFMDNCHTVVFVDEGVQIKSATAAKIHPDVWDNIIGEYLANFTWPTLMSENGSSE